MKQQFLNEKTIFGQVTSLQELLHCGEDSISNKLERLRHLQSHQTTK